MTADLEFGAVGDHGTAAAQRAAAAAGQGAAAGRGGAGRAAGQPVRSPAMRAYCATLARFTSSVQSTEQLLRNDDAGTREDTEQRELTATSRLRGIDRAALAAADGLDHCAGVRSAHGLPLPPATWGTDESPEYGGDRLDPSGGASLIAGGRDLRRSSSDDDGRLAGTGNDRGPVPHALGRPGPSDPRAELGDGGWAGAGNGRDPRPGGLDRTGASDPRAELGDGGWAGAGNGRDPRPGEPGGSSSRATNPGHAGGAHPGTTGTTSQGAGLDRLRRSGGGADLGVALTSLGRRRDALRLAEEEFAGWLAARDEQTRRISLGAAVGAGLAGAAVMVVVGTRTSAAGSLALLAACTLAVVAVGVGVAAARKSPRVCRGAGLARRPHPLGLARYAATIGGLALLALAAANIGAGAL